MIPMTSRYGIKLDLMGSGQVKVIMSKPIHVNLEQLFLRSSTEELHTSVQPCTSHSIANDYRIESILVMVGWWCK